MKSGSVHKILIAGESGVGKTCLLYALCNEEFDSTTYPTIGIDMKTKMVQINGVDIKLLFWDTAGQERFRSIVQSYYRGTNIVILTYDVSNRETFIKVPYWYDDVAKNCTNAEFYLIGCKTDLKRDVLYEEGASLADKLKMPYYECSSKYRDITGIQNILDAIIQSIQIREIETNNSLNLNNIKTRYKKCCN